VPYLGAWFKKGARYCIQHDQAYNLKVFGLFQQYREKFMFPSPLCRMVWLPMLSVAVALGCDGSSHTAAVDGSVTVGGVPVESGSITFVPIEGTSGHSAGGAIESGRYSISAADGPMIGVNSVAINGRRKTGRKIPVPGTENVMMDETEEVVPPRYQTGKELKREIRPGKNTFDFDLDAQ
jgi:hypothetical protein